MQSIELNQQHGQLAVVSELGNQSNHGLLIIQIKFHSTRNTNRNNKQRRQVAEPLQPITIDSASSSNIVDFIEYYYAMDLIGL